MKFTDVPDTHWASCAILHGVDKGYVEGYEDGTFKPNNGMTRAEFCAIIARRDPKYDGKTLYIQNFADCTSYEWFHSYASFCYMKGYINVYPIEGTDKVELRPNQLITREEAAVGLAKTFKEV